MTEYITNTRNPLKSAIRGLKKEGRMPYIYKYVNKETDDVEYVGIIKADSNFPRRFDQHKSDSWYKPNKYTIYYSAVESQTDAEALEGHFISLYESYKFHNKAKDKWGICSFAPEVSWEEYEPLLAIPIREELTSSAEFKAIQDEARTLYNHLGLFLNKYGVNTKTLRLRDPEDDVPTMLTIRETADRTGVSYDCIRKLCIQREIVHIKAGTKYLVNYEKFCEYLLNENRISL